MVSPFPVHKVRNTFTIGEPRSRHAYKHALQCGLELTSGRDHLAKAQTAGQEQGRAKGIADATAQAFPEAFTEPTITHSGNGVTIWRTMRRAIVAIFVAVVASSADAWAQFVQQGNKLVGTPPVLFSRGRSVALSADGNTALIGSDGAVRVWTRSGAVWSPQGAPLVGTNDVGNADQGVSVALSADGNTALVGGWADDGGNGAAWVFTRSGGTWTQQGGKLVGTGAAFGGGAQQGYSVALSADGNTALVGGYSDNVSTGAAWVWTRSGSVWTQDGPKLVGTGAVGTAQQGAAVALAGDGNTAIVGGQSDSSFTGAAWVFTRIAGIWIQQGTKLVGSGTGILLQGVSVALSADGNTALVGGDHGVGAVWVWTRSGSAWTQQGASLVGNGAVGGGQGGAVSLSADGNEAFIGSDDDNFSTGAAWVWARNGGVWTQQGAKLVGSGYVTTARQGASVALSADGHTALVGGPADASGGGAAWVFVSGSVGPPFTDDPLITGTIIKAVHILELRVRINAQLVRFGRPEHSFSNPIIAGVSIIKAVDLTELYTAVNDALTAAGQPMIVMPTVTPGVTIAITSQISNLRVAVLTLEQL